MRNPLARLAKRGPAKPTLRQRFTATKAKARQVLNVNRALLKPLPKPEPAVDRIALVNYATWLSFERDRVCCELYPNQGRKAVQFTLTGNAAERFFWPAGIGNHISRSHLDVPPASTRALKVLDLVGVNWREDADPENRSVLDGPEMQDDGERPAVPHGWPAPDAALTLAFGDLRRVESAITTLLPADGRDPMDAPGYSDLDEARGALLATLQRERARTLRGLQAKAGALLMDTVEEYQEDFREIAQSLARDLLGAWQSFLEPRPDPIFAVIAECERLEAINAALDLRDKANPTLKDISPETERSAVAVWDHLRKVVFKTQPTTGRGCAAFARFVSAFYLRWGSSIDDDAPAILSLISQSPMF